LPTLIGLLTLKVLCAAGIGEPVRGTFKIRFEASELTETPPVKLPDDCGKNVTLNDVLCPGVRVTGVVIPEMLNPVPLVATWEMCAIEPPVFVTVSVWVEL
jgi:hypothetical protein